MNIHYKLGFIGMGNMSQTIIKGLIDSKVINSNQIFASNRTPGKLQKAQEQFAINVFSTNEEVIDASDVIIIATKPQDFNTAIDPIISSFREKQVVMSLAAGLSIDSIQKKIPQTRVARVVPNTPSVLRKGVIGYLLDGADIALSSLVEDIFSPLGSVYAVEDEDQLNALLVASSSGVGFIFELMLYFQEWIEERGFPTPVARKIVVNTFLGTSLLADQSPEISLEDLQNRVVSKKGVTAAGLESMRELEIERLLRYSFEKADLRNQELAKQI